MQAHKSQIDLWVRTYKSRERSLAGRKFPAHVLSTWKKKDDLETLKPGASIGQIAQATLQLWWRLPDCLLS